MYFEIDNTEILIIMKVFLRHQNPGLSHFCKPPYSVHRLNFVLVSVYKLFQSRTYFTTVLK